jgi:uncharacterized membrane protein
MLARLRSTWFAIRASYWFYPALFSASGFLLALYLLRLDRLGAATWLATVSWYQVAQAEGASNMLTVLAGSMIGVASTVFSITIAAVAYASGTYGPRLLTNFMEDKGNQLSLATFIGTFVYAITVLMAVRGADETTSGIPGFVPQLALLAAFGLMLVSVAVLVFFLHHIPSSIRINAVLEGIGRGLLDKIAKRFPDAYDTAPSQRDPPEGEAVTASGEGYIRYIALGELCEVAEKAEVRIGLAVRAGDFVYAGRPLASVEGEDLPDGLFGDIRACFALGGSRTPEQDLEFSIDELVEIAMRALSPGINDPFTAITAIHWLGAAMAELGQRQLDGLPGQDGGGEVIPLIDDFEHYVRRGFGAMRSAIAGSKIAAMVALETLDEAAKQTGDAGRTALLRSEMDLLLAQACASLAGPELDEVRARHAQLRRC